MIDCLDSFTCTTPINASKSAFANLVIVVEVICCVKELLESVYFPGVIFFLLQRPVSKQIKVPKSKNTIAILIKFKLIINPSLGKLVPDLVFFL